MFPWSDNLYGVVKNGVLTLSGYSIAIREADGCLIVRDGLQGRSEIEMKFTRAACPISRLIVVRPDGYITFSAIEWLWHKGISVLQVGRDGNLMMLSVPEHSVSVSRRRQQISLNPVAGPGGGIVRELLDAKCKGQISVLRAFGYTTQADAADLLISELRTASAITDLLSIEGRVATLYWPTLAERSLSFGKGRAAPHHWQLLGSRTSPLSGGPRNAATPAQAIWNYLYSVAASEVTIALHAAGFDPLIGILHSDKDDRASLTYDLLEAIRPVIDLYFLRWIDDYTFARRDFIEDAAGGIRVVHPLNSHLAMTAPLWRHPAEQIVTWFAAALSGERIRLRLDGLPTSHSKSRARFWRPGRGVARPIPPTCAHCGRVLPKRQRRFCSVACQREFHGPESIKVAQAAITAKRAAGQIKFRPYRRMVKPDHVPLISEWQTRPEWSPEKDAAMTAWYQESLAPALTALTPIDIRRSCGVSVTSSQRWCQGRAIPHPRWYAALAELAGVEYPW
jgi:CRISPR-associated protein Cas1